MCDIVLENFGGFFFKGRFNILLDSINILKTGLMSMHEIMKLMFHTIKKADTFHCLSIYILISIINFDIC